ncbi:hypothetical protein ABK040_010413 [Willaertia magna]
MPSKKKSFKQKTQHQESLSSTLDACDYCDKKLRNRIPRNVQEFWLQASLKKKLQLLQIDCKFVLDQIRCSSPYTTKDGDKPAFLSKPSSCLCPACRKKKAIFNAVIAVFEDYVSELDGNKKIETTIGDTSSLTENDHMVVRKQLQFCKITGKHQFSGNQLPFGSFLTVSGGKLTVKEEYLKKDNGQHFFSVMKKCEEVFPNDITLGPNVFPAPENIHMLINYCTMNSELNIKKIMLKNAKKALHLNNAKNLENKSSHHHHHQHHHHQQVSQVSPPVTISTSNTSIHIVPNSPNANNSNVASSNGMNSNSPHFNPKVVNGSIAMVHLGNVKDLIREGGGTATVVLNHLHSQHEDEETDEEVEEDEETDEEEEDEDYSTEEQESEEEDENNKEKVDDSNKKSNKDRERNEILASNMRESKLLFQIYLARLFAHNIRVAFNDLCAYEMQKCLLEECEKEEMKKGSNNKKKKNKGSSKHKKKDIPTATTPSKTNDEKVVVSHSNVDEDSNDISEEKHESEEQEFNEEEEEEEFEENIIGYATEEQGDTNWNLVSKKPKPQTKPIKPTVSNYRQPYSKPHERTSPTHSKKKKATTPRSNYIPSQHPQHFYSTSEIKSTSNSTTSTVKHQTNDHLDVNQLVNGSNAYHIRQQSGGGSSSPNIDPFNGGLSSPTPSSSSYHNSTVSSVLSEVLDENDHPTLPNPISHPSSTFNNMHQLFSGVNNSGSNSLFDTQFILKSNNPQPSYYHPFDMPFQQTNPFPSPVYNPIGNNSNALLNHPHSLIGNPSTTTSPNIVGNQGVNNPTWFLFQSFGSFNLMENMNNNL